MNLFNNKTFYFTITFYGLFFQFFCLIKAIYKSRAKYRIDMAVFREIMLLLMGMFAAPIVYGVKLFPIFSFVLFFRCLFWFSCIITQDVENKNSKLFVFGTSVIILIFKFLITN